MKKFKMQNQNNVSSFGNRLMNRTNSMQYDIDRNKMKIDEAQAEAEGSGAAGSRSARRELVLPGARGP